MGLRWIERRQGRGWIGLDDEHRKVAQVDPAIARGSRCWHAQLQARALFGVALGVFDSAEEARAAVDSRL